MRRNLIGLRTAAVGTDGTGGWSTPVTSINNQIWGVMLMKPDDHGTGGDLSVLMGNEENGGAFEGAVWALDDVNLMKVSVTRSGGYAEWASASSYINVGQWCWYAFAIDLAGLWGGSDIFALFKSNNIHEKLARNSSWSSQTNGSGDAIGSVGNWSVATMDDYTTGVVPLDGAWAHAIMGQGRIPNEVDLIQYPIHRKPLVGTLFQFDGGRELSTSRLLDQSGNGNHATAIGTGHRFEDLLSFGGRPRLSTGRSARQYPGRYIFAQRSVPTSVISIGGWTDQSGGTTNIHEKIDEGLPPDDTDYIRSSTAPTDDQIQLGMTSMNAPEDGAVRIRIRYGTV